MAKFNLDAINCTEKEEERCGTRPGKERKPLFSKPFRMF